MKTYIIIFLIFFTLFASAQEQLTGIVLEANGTNQSPLPGANVYWLGSSVGGITNEDGTFSIPYKFSYEKLVISYVGFKTDTISVAENRYIKHVLHLFCSKNALIKILASKFILRFGCTFR